MRLPQPAPGMLQHIASRYGVLPQDLWVVGLCQPHIQAGLAIGAHVALVAPAPALHVTCTQCADTRLPRYPSWHTLAQALAPD